MALEQQLDAIDAVLRVDTLRFELSHHGKKAVVYERLFAKSVANAL